MTMSVEKSLGLSIAGTDADEKNLGFDRLGIGSWLRARALATPQEIAFRYLKKNGAEVSEHRFGDIDLEARRLAAWLRGHGRPGDRVLLAHAPGPEFVEAFFACQYAGFIAVPAFPPRRTRHGNRVTGMLEDADCRLALADAVGRAAMEAARQDEGAWSRVQWPKPEDLTGPALEAEELHRPDADDIAFLQYTSGSTGAPKGVMVSHANLKHNVDLQRTASGFEPGSLMVSWVPFFHDFGLIHGLLCPIACGGAGVYMPPSDFMQAPELWLRTISDYRASHACAPNFAYDLCVRVVDEQRRGGLDLTHWRYCVDGSEPVRASSVRGFEEAFARCGVRQGLIQPAYGLAENTLYVSSGYPGEKLEEIKEERTGAENRSLVVCGRVPGQTVVIVDPLNGRPCKEGQVGEIWIQGESVAKGYWHKPVETEETFGGRLSEIPGSFLRTGDLGFTHGDRLVVSGRLKDLLIVRGAKHYPQDLEATSKSTSSELAACAAFSVDGPEGERLVLVQETTRHPKAPLEALAEDITRAVSREHGVRVSALLLVPTNSVPRTSSGKIQRRACRAAYLDGSLKATLSWPLDEKRTRTAPDASATASVEERLAWIRATALELGGVEPAAGFEATLDSWSLDSLKIAELSARYQRDFGQDLGAMAHPDQSLRILLGVEAPLASQAGAPARRWRCHAALESIWAFQKAAPESDAYHMSWTVRLSGRPDSGRIRTALLRLAQSQIALRSHFDLDDESVLWQVEGRATAPLELPWSSEGSLEDAEQWAKTWNRIPFDLASQPLWRAAFLPLAGGGSLLAFAFHHLIFDQRSLDVFRGDLDALVMDPSRNLKPQSDVPPRCPEGSESQQDSRNYWRGHLQGWARESWLDPSLLSIPRAPGILRAEVPEETMAALRRLALSVHSTPFAVAALAWSEALADLSGAEEACFTVPFTLRELPLSDSRIGYWVHPLPIRLKMPLGQDARAGLLDASKALREASAHRHLSTAEAMRCVGMPAPASMLTVTYLEESARTTTFLGSPATMKQLPSSASRAALTMEVSGEKSWTVCLEHHPLAVPEAKALRCLQVFLDACQRYAGQAPLSGLSRLKSGSLPPGEHGTVLEAFHARVFNDSQATAIVSAQGKVDYGTLATQVRAVARTLIQAGVRPGDRVGVCSQASGAWVAAMLGCFEAGAVYVPLDPAYPADRLKAMLDDSECRMVLSDIQAPEWAGACPWGDIHRALSASPPYLRQPGRPRPEDAAYVIFTSGSSGRPKGVQVSHAALMNNARGIGKRLKLSPQDRVMQFCSISFDPSLQDVLPTLTAGACVALPQRKGVLGPNELASFVRQHAVSLFLLPTAYWHAFMQAGGAELLKDSPSLRCIMVGGEAPSPRWVREWNRILPKAAFYNAYGPTEACVAVTLFECKPDESADGPIPLGQPLPGVELAVVDPEGRLLPVGESGELWIAGACLADGYIGPQGLDRSRFGLAGPDGEEPRAFYRTGDRAVMDKRGRLLHQGRMDRQIKAAGIRMDLEEIESQLGRAEGVSSAVVDASGSGDALSLRAWVAATPGMNPDPEVLKEWLKKSLPQACVPSEIRVLKAFPLNLSGKIDRQALMNLSSFNGPASPRETEVPSKFSGAEVDLVGSLCTAFSVVLGRPVDPSDDFFALGGTSLRAVRLAGEAGRRSGRGVLVDQIYQAPTPKGLAALLSIGTGPESGQGILRPLSKGPGPAWVLLPPSSGRLASYRGLGRLLEGRAQVWGFDLGQLPAPEAGDWNAWVESCVRALDAALPDAELVLGGWSMGGLLAADMARALVQRGRIVRRIVFIDVLVPDPLRNALALMDPSALESLLERDLEGAALPEEGAAGSEEERRRYHLHVKATSGFILAPLPVPMSVVISEHSSREEPRSSWMAWSLMARAGMTCLLVPGDHFSVLGEANLKRISERLVDDVEAGRTGGLVRV